MNQYFGATSFILINWYRNKYFTNSDDSNNDCQCSYNGKIIC